MFDTGAVCYGTSLKSTTQRNERDDREGGKYLRINKESADRLRYVGNFPHEMNPTTEIRQDLPVGENRQ